MPDIQRRPTSERELETLLKKAYGYAEKRQYEEALRICNWLIEEKSTLASGLRERAAVKEHMGAFEDAIKDLRDLISMNTDEPSDYHQLGVLLLVSGNIHEAIDYFSKAIELGERANFNYYTNSSLLHRAEAELRNGNWEKVNLDCQRLPAGYRVYLRGKGIRTREQIETEAKKGLLSD